MTPIRTGTPQPDADAVRFEVRNGMRRVGCTVSSEALEAASGLALPSTTSSRRQSFDRFRTVSNTAAIRKLGTLPADFTGPLALSGDALRVVPARVGDPLFGSTRRLG